MRAQETRSQGQDIACDATCANVDRDEQPMGELPLVVDLGNVIEVDPVLLEVDLCSLCAVGAVVRPGSPCQLVDRSCRVRLVEGGQLDRRDVRGLDEKVRGGRFPQHLEERGAAVVPEPHHWTLPDRLSREHCLTLAPVGPSHGIGVPVD